MVKKDVLKNWVCTKPFNYLDIQENKAYLCCPSWLPEDITENGTKTITEGWYSQKSKAIRDSMLDGSFRYCNHKTCPDISQVLGGRKDQFSFMKHKKNFTPPKEPQLENILYGQDRSCNMYCPSCRLNIIPNSKLNSPEHNRKQALQDEIEQSFGSSIKTIMLTGSGDPIYSKIYRDFLINFDKTKYPNIQTIQIVTNGILLNEKMWNSFNCHEFIKIFDISFDAGTRETYEGITRLGGEWNRLLDNIQYLVSRTDIKRNFVFSYVVSEHNYKEMHLAYSMMKKIMQRSKHRWQANFRQHLYWEAGAYTQEQVADIAVFDTKHHLHADFLYELKKLHNQPYVNHNFHHLIR